VAFRLISTGLPGELKNYIIKSGGIEKAYAASTEAKSEFKIYKFELRDPFALGDALYLESALYFENAENLQFTLRCKGSGLREMGLDKPFARFYLKVYPDFSEIDPEYIILRFNALESHPKGRYEYLALSFDGVKIDYAKTKVEMYLLGDGAFEEFNENETLARFTLFDVNMTKKKMAAKKFKLG